MLAVCWFKNFFFLFTRQYFVIGGPLWFSFMLQLIIVVFFVFVFALLIRLVYFGLLYSYTVLYFLLY